MNSEATPPESPAPADAGAGKPATAPPRRPRPLVLVLIVLAAAFAGLWLESRLRLAGMQEELARRLAESDAQTRQARAAAGEVQEGMKALQGRVGALEAQLAESQGQRLALEEIYQELSKSREDRVVAEVEQAVATAAQQLQLAGNVETALIALTGAEARLARSANPQFLGLRKLIARDIERLRAMPTADLSGMAMRLEGLIISVDALPFAFEQRPQQARSGETAKPAAAAPAQPSAWQRLGTEIWSELKQLVRIERIDGAADPVLLSPSQSFFIRENLRLRLVSARLALLARDARSFREDMRQSREWLERHFDGRAKPVQNALAAIKAMSATDLAVAPPSLNETLAALQNFKSRK